MLMVPFCFKGQRNYFFCSRKPWLKYQHPVDKNSRFFESQGGIDLTMFTQFLQEIYY